ncbi:MAG: hypothetical protein KGJ59_00875 [Bacteroidota bacterium]|nr:hypothetical protein [Bacteroidota bacterium]
MIYAVLLIFPAVNAMAGTFEERKAELLQEASNERGRNIFLVAAKIATHHDERYALTMLDSLINDQQIGGMFYSYQMIATYLYLQSGLPDSLKEKIRTAYRTRTMYRGDTENHWVAYYTGLYLAAQTWHDEDGSHWFNGKSSKENFDEAKDWLNEWMRITTTIGQGEFDSPTYFIVFITPMMALQQFALDNTMKKKAEMMADYLFADFAVENLNGNYCGAHSRDYPEDIVNPLRAPNVPWAWLYFGTPKNAPWLPTLGLPRQPVFRHPTSSNESLGYAWEVVFGALSSYRLPEIIFHVATDRSVPYVDKEQKRVRNIIRFGKEMNPQVYKYTYMTDQYALGSIQGGILQPIQQHTWDVTYVSDKPGNTLFTLNPFYSGKELAMFFPEEQKFLTDEVNRYHKVYTDPNKWNSSSPYEQTFQCKNAIIVLYNITPTAHHRQVDGFFSKNLDERITLANRWILCKAGKTYIAFFPLKQYEWIEEPNDWRWRSYDVKNGVVVEVGRESEYGSFEAFRKTFSAAAIDAKDFDKTLTVRYTTHMGDTMQFTYGGARILNGHTVDFSHYKLFDSPFLHSDIGSGVLTMTYKNMTRILDFNAVAIRNGMVTK